MRSIFKWTFNDLKLSDCHNAPIKTALVAAKTKITYKLVAVVGPVLVLLQMTIVHCGINY